MAVKHQQTCPPTDSYNKITPQPPLQIQIGTSHSRPYQNNNLPPPSIIAKILTSKTFDTTTVTGNTLREWGVQDGVYISQVRHNTFLFHFSCEQLLHRITTQGPWNVMGSLISVKKWDSNILLERVTFNLVPFWIQLHGLPPQNFNFDYVAKIGKKLGSLLQVENPYVNGQFLRSFYRIRVTIDTSKPLSTGCWVPRENLPHARVDYKYENLLDYCLNCGCLGHDTDKCKQDKAMSFVNPIQVRYTPDLGVPTAKSLELLASTCTRGTKFSVLRNIQGESMHPNKKKKQHTLPANATKVDLLSGLIQPGLGPNSLDDLQLETEDVGLKKPIVITDYPSLTKDGSSHYSISFTASMIIKCRNSWLLQKKDTNPLP
ncbi:Zinc knuckle CX2CX4HX4C [Sesbania bispinosa]|nr:Zinc knuckle CX2CX4HX4C [Sesbania bispinosa]